MPKVRMLNWHVEVRWIPDGSRTLIVSAPDFQSISKICEGWATHGVMLGPAQGEVRHVFLPPARLTAIGISPQPTSVEDDEATEGGGPGEG
ncbi:hypothetical protein LCGC14_2600300 [marine sediment metagenome]|uniref:Uncharacterized protein n=1 Tax=marine sediment metagenome TaxID=412755 RepID=A0A0F9CJW6_9ZZZZ